MTKVSIIVPAYNSEKYIERAIKSLIEQTYKDLEIIIVNDGSSDNTGLIVEKLASYDSRIKLINQRNMGVSIARNTGLEFATGDFIGFIDSDDYAHKQMYEILIDNASKYEASIVECGFFSVKNDGEITGNYNFSPTIIDNPEESIKNFLLSKNSRAFPWNKLFRKEALKGIKFKKYNYSEDYLFNLHVLNNSIRKVTIPNKLYYYVEHQESAVNVPFSKRKLDIISANKEALEFVENNYKQMATLSAINLLDSIRILYYQLSRSRVESKEKIQSDLFNAYKTEYRKYKKSINSSLIKTRKKIFLCIFYYVPAIANYITYKKSIK